MNISETFTVKNTLLIVALLITLVSYSAKATPPCPDDPSLTCTNWVWFEETIQYTLPGPPPCNIMLTYQGFQRTCTDPLGRTSMEFYIYGFDFFTQPCLNSYLNEGGYFHADRYSAIIKDLAQKKSLNYANTFFLDQSNKTAYACNPNCVTGQTFLQITYSAPYCFSVCKAVEEGITYYMHTACSLYKCCIHKNKYCWDALNLQVQFCEGVTEEYDWGYDPRTCGSYETICIPEVGSYPPEFNWEAQTDSCAYFCQ